MAQRAVGSAEQKCRETNTCLQNFELDGAIGWNWGAKDRCDPSDPLCGNDGKLRNTPLIGSEVPKDDLDVTHIVTMNLLIGKGSQSESTTLKFGLFGKVFPSAVQEMIAFCGGGGLVTTSELLFDEGYGATSAPLSLQKGGAMNLLIPGERIDFGVESQGLAYAKSRGMNKLPENFIPQPRPKPLSRNDETTVSPRKHDVAGLISVPKEGLGYGGTGFESEDEAYGSAFQITAGAVPAADKEGRKVVGRIMDQDSMAVLARLASLPTKKGIKGVIPGQNYGPPFLRVLVKDVTVEVVN